jgi:AcrR family transcriptional regulator
MAERGRPRGFNLEDGLDRAVEVFWRQGFEGASLSDLTGAMGINRPSLYAAYGDKAALFRRAVARYAETDMEYARVALNRATAVDVARSFLQDNVDAVTRTDRPLGCLTIQGGTACRPENAAVAESLASSRLQGESALAERFDRAVAEGDLRADTDTAALARFVMTVSEGQAVHAAAGVPAEQLHASAEIAVLAVAAAGHD